MVNIGYRDPVVMQSHGIMLRGINSQFNIHNQYNTTKYKIDIIILYSRKRYLRYFGIDKDVCLIFLIVWPTGSKNGSILKSSINIFNIKDRLL